jgi:hypothetical protein
MSRLSEQIQDGNAAVIEILFILNQLEPIAKATAIQELKERLQTEKP